jgi:hypothetical protein
MTDLDEFAAEMERGNPYVPLPQEIVPDELVKAAKEASRFIADLVRCRSYGGLYVKETNHALQAALTLPRTTIKEAEARGAAKERERLAKAAIDDAAGICQERYLPDDRARALRYLAKWLRAQGGGNAG